MICCQLARDANTHHAQSLGVAHHLAEHGALHDLAHLGTHGSELRVRGDHLHVSSIVAGSSTHLVHNLGARHEIRHLPEKLGVVHKASHLRVS